MINRRSVLAAIGGLLLAPLARFRSPPRWKTVRVPYLRWDRIQNTAREFEGVAACLGRAAAAREGDMIWKVLEGIERDGQSSDSLSDPYYD